MFSSLLLLLLAAVFILGVAWCRLNFFLTSVLKLILFLNSSIKRYSFPINIYWLDKVISHIKHRPALPRIQYGTDMYVIKTEYGVMILRQ